MITSSNFPTGLIVDLFASSRIVGVGLMFSSPNVFIVSTMIMLMAAPKSTSTLGISTRLIYIVRIEFPGSPYFTGMVFANMMSDNLPIT